MRQKKTTIFNRTVGDRPETSTDIMTATDYEGEPIDENSTPNSLIKVALPGVGNYANNLSEFINTNISSSDCSFEIISGGENFNITTDTGEITNTATLNYETQAFYELNILVATEDASQSVRVYVFVNDVNEGSNGYNNLSSLLTNTLIYQNFEIDEVVYYFKVVNNRLFYKNDRDTENYIEDGISSHATLYAVYNKSGLPFTFDMNALDNKLYDDGYTNTFFTEIAPLACGGLNIEKIVFSKFLRYIGSSAFKGCSFIRKLYFPNTEKEIKIDRYAFADCTELRFVVLSENVSTIPPNCFLNCTELRVLYTGYVEKIQYGSFYENAIDGSANDAGGPGFFIPISSNLKEIEADAFKYKNAANENSVTKLIFHPTIINFDGTNTNIVNYDINSNKISRDAFYVPEDDSPYTVTFELQDLPVSSSWYSYFVDLSNTNTNVNFTLTYTSDGDENIVDSYYPDGSYILVSNDVDIHISNIEITDNITNTTINHVETNVYLVYPNTYKTNITSGVNSPWDILSQSGWTYIDFTFKYAYEGDITREFEHNTIQLMKTQDNIYINFLKPFFGRLIFRYQSFKITFQNTYELPKPIVIHPLSQSNVNLILYSNDYVILDSSSNGSFDNNTILNNENLINDTIYFGLTPNAGDVTSYNIKLVQDLSEDISVNLYTGYIENEYLLDISFIYNDTTILDDRIYYTSDMANYNISPILSWNGDISLSVPDISWADASSVRLQLNNRQVTCYFVYYEFGHVNDPNGPTIVDLGDVIASSNILMPGET